MLSQAQIARYHADGFIVVPDVLTADQVTRARQALDAIVARARGVSANTDVYDLEDSHAPERPRVRRIKAPHKVDPVFMEVVRSERLLGAVDDLIGPGVRLQNSKLNLKSAGYGAAVEWHQDWAFYPYTNDDVLAVGVMLDDITLENGPMLVLPGTHKGPIYDHHADGRFCGAIDPVASKMDFGSAVPIVGTAGSISLHHARAVHGSDVNRSGRDRRFLLYELCAIDAWPLAGGFAAYSDFDEFNARILRGKPTNQPRLRDVPVRMPLPKSLDPSSIYQAQKAVAHRFFGVAEEAKAPAK